MGASDYTFDLETGRGSIVLPPEAAVDPSALEDAVRGAGFELLDLEISVRGHLVQVAADSTPLLELTPGGQRILLVEGHSERERRAWSRLATRLDRPGLALSVRGGVHDHPGGEVAVVVQDFEVGS